MSEMMGWLGGTWNGIVHFSGGLCIFGRRERNWSQVFVGVLRNCTCFSEIVEVMEFVEDSPDFLLVGGEQGGVAQPHIMVGIIELAHGFQFVIFPRLCSDS